MQTNSIVHTWYKKSIHMISFIRNWSFYSTAWDKKLVEEMMAYLLLYYHSFLSFNYPFLIQYSFFTKLRVYINLGLSTPTIFYPNSFTQSGHALHRINNECFSNNLDKSLLKDSNRYLGRHFRVFLTSCVHK